jgi:hypothetical protein
MLRKPSFAAPLALLLAFTGVQYARGIIIDDFSAGELVIDGPATQDQTGIDPAHVIGGSRRIQLGQFGNGSHIEIADDLFKFSSAGWGYTTLTYGAVESLGGLDLTQNGHDRFRIKFGKVTTKYTPMALYVNLFPNSSSNGIQWTAKQEWDGSTFEIPFANFPSTLTTVHKIVFDAFRNQAGTEFEIESISTAGPSLAGDFNRDGAVNADDVEVWQQQSGMDTRNGSILRVIATADANLDGRVDGADFLAWQRTVGGQTTPAIAIPEPASLLTALATAFALTPLLRTARRNC